MTLQEDIQKKQEEIAQIQRDRPGTKQEYLSTLETKQGELNSLVIQKAEEDRKIEEEINNSPEIKTMNLDLEYGPQFSALSTAYMAAFILGDTETMTANRTAYQALLDEYNLKLESIG